MAGHKNDDGGGRGCVDFAGRLATIRDVLGGLREKSSGLAVYRHHPRLGGRVPGDEGADSMLVLNVKPARPAPDGG